MIFIMKEKLFDKYDSKYIRFEVIDKNGNTKGGLFRGLNEVCDKLWDDDDPLFDELNEPLSKLGYITPYPDNLTDKNIKFAYKNSFYAINIEEFKEIEYVLEELGLKLISIPINDVNKVYYEDDVQIAYV